METPSISEVCTVHSSLTRRVTSLARICKLDHCAEVAGMEMQIEIRDSRPFGGRAASADGGGFH